MKRLLFLLLLAGSAVYGYFWYVRGVDILRGNDPTSLLPAYVYSEKPAVKEGGYWLAATPMPTPRIGAAAAAVGGRIFVVGGRDGFGRTVDKVEIFDIFDNTWSTGAPLPLPLQGLSLVSVQNKLYAIGGLKGLASIPSQTLFIYDAESGSWNRGADPPRGVGLAAAAARDERIHIFGGRSATGSISAHYVYDPLTNAWGQGEEMNSVREAMSAVVVDGKIYLAGGREGSSVNNLRTFEVFDPENNLWDDLEPMPTRRGDGGGTDLSGKIYVFGGDAATTTFDQVETYAPGERRWRSASPMPAPLHGFALASVNGRAYVFGGGQRPGWSVTDFSLVYVP